MREAVERLGAEPCPYAWIVLTSPNAAQRTLRTVKPTTAVRVAAIGPGTAAVCRELGFHVEGISVAGVETWLRVPEWSLAIDVGRSPEILSRCQHIALTHAHTEGCQAVMHSFAGSRASVHLIDQGGQNACAGTAQRMTQRNCSAIDISDCFAQRQFP